MIVKVAYDLFSWIEFVVFFVAPQLALEDRLDSAEIYSFRFVRVVGDITSVRARVQSDYSPGACVFCDEFLALSLLDNSFV